MPTITTPSAPLDRLRSDIARLRLRRSLVRRGTALATGVLLLLGALSVAFTVDYVIDLSPIQRTVAFLGILAATIWIARKIKLLSAQPPESDAEIALQVGRQHGISGDLLAALQFQTDEINAWGSPQLKQAVIGNVGEASRDLDVFDSFQWSPLPKRLLSAAVGILIAMVFATSFPQHAQIFAKRLLLADVSYPTRTVISSLAINGKSITLSDRTPLFVPAGASVQFVATADRLIPESGLLSLRGDSGGETDLPLKPHLSSPSQFSGTLESLTEPISFRVLLGDAKSSPRRIELVPRPSVTLDLIPIPPAYAASNAPEPPPPGVRTASILGGSSLKLIVNSTNKPLASTKILIRPATPANKDQRNAQPPVDALDTITLSPSSDRMTWTLDPNGTPFSNIQDPFSFEVRATDDEGLTPMEPVIGTVKLRADRPPRVSASAVVRYLLPSGKPTISYSANDDFGLKAMHAALSITKSDGTETEPVRMPLPFRQISVTEAEGRHPFDLSSLSLAPGDRVTLRVEAEDARGDRPGVIGASEPVVFEITDRQGLLATLREADERSADQLDAIIRRELGIGGER